MSLYNLERSVLEECLNRELHTILLQTRYRMNLTQSAMAKRYCMAKNTYSDLESERHGFGLLTAVLLLCDQEDPKKVLDELTKKMEQVLAEETLIV